MKDDFFNSGRVAGIATVGTRGIPSSIHNCVMCISNVSYDRVSTSGFVFLQMSLE